MLSELGWSVGWIFKTYWRFEIAVALVCVNLSNARDTYNAGQIMQSKIEKSPKTGKDQNNLFSNLSKNFHKIFVISDMEVFVANQSYIKMLRSSKKLGLGS